MEEVNFGPFLKSIRKSKNLSIVKLAEMSGVSNPYISQIENNKFIPSIDVVTKLAKSLNVDMIELAQKAGYLSEADITLTAKEEKGFEAAAFLQTSEELYTVNQQITKTKSEEERATLLKRKERLEKRISKKWSHYDEVFKDVIEYLKDEVSLIEANNKAFENGTSIPVFVDEHNNLNIKVYKNDFILNEEDTRALNQMIKGFLYDKKFINYNEEQ